MSSPASLLPELDQALERGSPARRAEMLLSIATLFRESASQLKNEHIALFEQLFERLLDGVDRNTRIELSRLLSGIDKAPSETIIRLANDDDIAVGRPVLEQSNQLDEPELANIARRKSQPHLLAISARNHLSASVADILVRRGNQQVLRRVAANASARMSEEAFGTLVERATADIALAACLAARPDFPPHLFRQLVLSADETVRQHFVANNAGLQPGLREILDAFAGTTAPRDYTAAQGRVLALHESGMLNESKVVEFAINKQRDDAVAAIALQCAVPVEVVDRVMSGERLDPILILCKSAGWSWQTVRVLATALPIGAGISGQALDVAYTNFERLSRTTSLRVMRFWQVQHWQPRATAL
jgi:uncharacterized protein (DUF2336 family)